MAIDVTAPRSWRALLVAAIGGLAASAPNALGRPTAALATDGQPVVQGADNSGSASTLVRSNTTTAFQGLADAASAPAYGVRGRSNSSAGAGVVGQVVAASGTNYGVRGIAASTSGGVGVRGEAPIRGVEGIATATTGGAVGVRAVTNSATGFGLAAENTATADDATAIGCQASWSGAANTSGERCRPRRSRSRRPRRRTSTTRVLATAIGGRLATGFEPRVVEWARLTMVR
jgi:hypothetical protein